MRPSHGFEDSEYPFRHVVRQILIEQPVHRLEGWNVQAMELDVAHHVGRGDLGNSNLCRCKSQPATLPLGRKGKGPPSRAGMMGTARAAAAERIDVAT